VLAHQLLRTCVLSGLGFERHLSVDEQALVLQKHMRYQYYRLIAKQPELRLTHTYHLNCPPPGFDVRPLTRSCNQPRVCPWCFVRRWLLPIYREFLAVPKELRMEHTVLAWQRQLPYTESPPFFRANYGPHQWCQSLASAQLVLPWYQGDSLIYRHVGFHLVPKDLDYRAALTRRVVKPAVTIKAYPQVVALSIVKALLSATQLPWLDLFEREQLVKFQLLASLGKGKFRLLRINKYKP
jgi:hypothetical protein